MKSKKSKRQTKQRKPYFVYLLRCRDNSLYCGQTNDLEKRVAAHASGTAAGSRYTRSRLPVRLVYHESVSDLSHALKREYAIKSMTKEEKERMVEGKIKSNGQ